VSTEEAERKGEKVYPTAGNGYLEGVCIFVSVGFWVLVVSEATALPDNIYAYVRLAIYGVAALIGLGRGVAGILREWNAVVIISEAGVTARDWRSVEKFIYWDRIRGVRYSGGWYTTLLLEVLDDQGQLCQERIAFSFGGSENFTEIAEVVASRLGLAEVANPRSFFTLKYGPPDIVWR